jgi:hypothetical protein
VLLSAVELSRVMCLKVRIFCFGLNQHFVESEKTSDLISGCFCICDVREAQPTRGIYVLGIICCVFGPYSLFVGYTVPVLCDGNMTSCSLDYCCIPKSPWNTQTSPNVGISLQTPDISQGMVAIKLWVSCSRHLKQRHFLCWPARGTQI